MPKNIQTKWASPENIYEIKGAAAKTNGGRKSSA